jgi:hypothetical protein
MEEIIEVSHGVRKIVEQLSGDLNFANDFKKRKQIMEILSAMCEIPDGHR